MTRAGEGGVHVLHLIYRLQPGGMEYGLVKLVNGLAGGRIRSTICSTCPADPAMAAQLAPGVGLVELSRRTGNDPLMVWQLYRLFRRARPDVVHSHAWGTLVEGLIAARAARVPVVMHGEHGTLQLEPYQIRTQRWAWMRTNKLLSVSSRLAERMSATVGVPLERITVIRNGVDANRFGSVSRAAARERLGLPDGVTVIGHVGRLVDVKNQASLVRAAAILKRRGLQPRVVIAGDGPLRSSLEQLITDLDVSDVVELIGHRSDVEWLYPALDVYVLCSRSEGMPNTILEAMASGVPVVSTQVGGADELVAHEVNGLLVLDQSPVDLADALQRLILAPSQRVAMGEAGRARAIAEFSVQAMARGYEQLYRQSMSTWAVSE